MFAVDTRVLLSEVTPPGDDARAERRQCHQTRFIPVINPSWEMTCVYSVWPVPYWHTECMRGIDANSMLIMCNYS